MGALKRIISELEKLGYNAEEVLYFSLVDIQRILEEQIKIESWQEERLIEDWIESQIEDAQFNTAETAEMIGG